MTWPDAVPFDPLAGTASPAIEALLEGPGSAGPVVLLAVGPLAQRGGWAAQTAIVLADAFAARGESVILADLSLHNPELHTLLGIDNEEGLTDVFLFGASLQHTARPIPGKWLRLIPASPFTPDTAEVLQHKHWSAVFEELAAQQNKLVAYLPVDLDGAHALSDRVGHTVVLADPYELDQVRSVLSEDADVISVLMPPGEVEAEPEPLPLLDEPVEEVVTEVPVATSTMERLDDAAFEKIRIPKDGARDALIADLRNRQRAALMAPPPAMTPLPHEVGEAPKPRSSSEATKPRSTEAMKARSAAAPVTPLFTMRPQPKPKKRGWLIAVLVVSLLAAASAGGWYWWQGRQVAPVAPKPVPPISQSPKRPVAPVVIGTKLPFSVAVASYQQLATADEQRGLLTRSASGIGFYVAPIVVQGKLFYRVLAGPVADSASATALKDTLIAKRIKTISSGWDVVATPYAFLVGEYTSRGDAEAKQQDAVKKGIPSYVVALNGDDGSITYRLYAGAFTGPGDADFMHQILKSAGLPDTLVERTGSIS